MYRLKIFDNNEQIAEQRDHESHDWLEGYAAGYLNFVNNDYDYVIAEV